VFAFEKMSLASIHLTPVPSRKALVLQRRLQDISTTGVDSRGLEGTPGDSIDGEKRLGIEVLQQKSCAINRLVDLPGSGSIPAASTISIPGWSFRVNNDLRY
jgi:hypothetical protein